MKTNRSDTSNFEIVIGIAATINPKATITIKSTVPVGYTKPLTTQYLNLKIIFSPEFIRGDKALYDNLYPSRIIVSPHSSEAKEFTRLLQ